MIETKFLIAGSNQEEALQYTCNLISKLFLNDSKLPLVNNLDILCAVVS